MLLHILDGTEEENTENFCSWWKTFLLKLPSSSQTHDKTTERSNCALALGSDYLFT